MKLDQKLLNEIMEYCNANGINDVTEFIGKCLRNGFNVEKYGSAPKMVTIQKPRGNGPTETKAIYPDKDNKKDLYND